MKRIGNLFEQIPQWSNLQHAFYRAQSGKALRPDVRAFRSNLDQNLKDLGEALSQGFFVPGPYQQFKIFDPKPRLITAPCFRDRVAHHAIMNVCEPIFERSLINDTYACRVGKGRLKALGRSVEYSGRFRYALKLDMRRYFDSISHEILMRLLARHFREERLLRLFQSIVEAFDCFSGRGLPIGSLTSQHFANFYLGPLDRFVKETLRLPGYVRYMDDAVLWSNERSFLKSCAMEIETFLGETVSLVLNPVRLSASRQGFDFLGCRVYPDHLKLNERSRRRFRRKMGCLDAAYHLGLWSEAACQQRAESLVAFAVAGGSKSWRYRRGVLQDLAVNS